MTKNKDHRHKTRTTTRGRISETIDHERRRLKDTCRRAIANSPTRTIACCACRPRCRTCAIARRAKSPTNASTRPCPCITDLLPVVDNIDRAIEAAEKAGEAENLLAGFRLVKQQLAHAARPAITASRSSPKAKSFDPNFHQAILQQPSARCARPAT